MASARRHRLRVRLISVTFFAIAFVVVFCALRSGTSYSVNVARKLSERVQLNRLSFPKQQKRERDLANTVLKPPLRLPFEPRVATTRDTSGYESALRSKVRYPDDIWRNISIQTGDNLSLIFARVGASPIDLQKILDADIRARQTLTKMQPQQVVRFKFEKTKLVELIYERDFLDSFRWTRTGQKYKADRITSKPEIRTASAIAEINHSLFIDGQKAGLSDRTITEFIHVFGWDIDFLRDLQRGDRFSVIFEEFYKDGQKVGNGKILAAEFINRGKRLRAIYYRNNNGVAGYFSEKGEAMRKTFLRTPVNFTRISSRFSLARRHPILSRIRAHKGVDYSAPMGTPIQAVADGKVEFAGWQGGYGRVVVLKHGNTYSTLYGHMSRIARDVQVGTNVNQGETIGYVGKTGLATGPHLHYEFRVNGQHRDPLAIKSLGPTPLEPKFQKNFRNETSGMIARLDDMHIETTQHDSSMVAGTDPVRERGPSSN